MAVKVFSWRHFSDALVCIFMLIMLISYDVDAYRMFPMTSSPQRHRGRKSVSTSCHDTRTRRQTTSLHAEIEKSPKKEKGADAITTAVGYVKPGVIEFPEDLSEDWELDCYSRPVLGEDGRKLWELLITDSQSDFKFIKTIPSNIVNSRNLRKAVEEVIELSPVRPKTIRFFRSQMFNMITIALGALDVDVKPSRRTHNLFMWLQQREKNIYPAMPGYNAQLRQQTILDFDVSQPDRLPDTIKSESYAFTALPAEVFFDGQVNEENIKRGVLCPIRELPKSASKDETRWVHGITLFSRRADAVASWMNGLDIAYLKSDLIARELLLNTDISAQFIVAPLMDAQKREAQIFERGKVEANGYHFISVQFSPDSEEVEGFWLLREFSNDL